MKVVRITEQAAYDAAAEQHKQVQAQHREHVERVRADNHEAREKQKRMVAEAKALTEESARRYREQKHEHEHALAAHQERLAVRKRVLASREGVLGKTKAAIAGAVQSPKLIVEAVMARDVSKLIAMLPPEPPEPQPPHDPVVIKVAAPVLVDEPPEPEFTVEPPEVFSVARVEGPPEPGKEGEEAVDYEAFVEVTTPWGRTIAQAGDYVLTSDRTGLALVVHADDFERLYTVA